MKKLVVTTLLALGFMVITILNPQHYAYGQPPDDSDNYHIYVPIILNDNIITCYTYQTTTVYSAYHYPIYDSSYTGNGIILRKNQYIPLVATDFYKRWVKTSYGWLKKIDIVISGDIDDLPIE